MTLVTQRRADTARNRPWRRFQLVTGVSKAERPCFRRVNSRRRSLLTGGPRRERPGGARRAPGPCPVCRGSASRNGAPRGVEIGRCALWKGVARRIVKTSQRTGDAGRVGASSRSDRDNGTFYVPVLGRWDPVPVRGSRDRRVAAVAAEQRGRANRRQLVTAGISSSQIETMLAKEWLAARFRGVYVVGHSLHG